MSYFNYQKNNNNYWYVFSNITTFIALSLLCISVIGYRLELFSVVFSLLTLTKYATYASLIALVLSLIAFGSTLGNYKFLSILNIIFNIIINIILVTTIYNSITALKSNPVINDISTNYDDVLQFKMYKKHNLHTDEHILLQEYGGFKKPSSSIVPLQINNKTLLEVFEASQNVLNNMGLRITYSNLEEGIIEGVARSFWYGFKDDIIIRIERLISDDIKVDIRSASRIGKSDFGVNSIRIRGILKKISSNLEN
jgi:uncharacterized protein (DUF1499 family)